MVRFSTGANELIEEDLDELDGDAAEEPVTVPNPEYDPEKHSGSGSDVRPYEVVNPGWEIVGVGRVDRDGEDQFAIKRSSVSYTEIDDASHLDPPVELPPDRPKPRIGSTPLSDY